MLPHQRIVAVLLVAAILLPACSTSEEAVAGGPERLPLLSFAELVDAISAGGDARGGRGLAEKLARQEGGALTASLRRELAGILKDAPRLHVLPRRRSLRADEDVRLEVEDTGQAIIVSRESLHRRRRRRPAEGKTSVNGPASLLSTATYHRYETTTPQGLLDINCTVQAVLKTTTNWNNKDYNLISHSVAGSKWVIAVVLRYPDRYKQAQWVTEQDDRNLEDLGYTPEGGWAALLGFSIIKYSYEDGQSDPSQQKGLGGWISGTGEVGFEDGGASTAVFSDLITSIAWHPSCSASDWLYNRCPPLTPGPGRPNFYQPIGGKQWVFVADSGNCRIRMLDYDTGRVSTRWGSGCVGAPLKDDLTQYKDSPISARNVLGSYLSVAWVSWKFVLVVDRDANRIRKFVTSQHQVCVCERERW